MVATLERNEIPTSVHDLQSLLDLVKSGHIKTFVPLLPLLLNLKGKPYTLTDFFPFEPMFHREIPKRITFKCGRQVSKSISSCAKHVLLTAANPYFNVLCVTPLEEQARRLSTLQFAPFVNESPVRHLLLGSGSVQNVRQKTFRNNSGVYFSFTGDDPSRIRSLSADLLHFDEIQNIYPGHIPIAGETMSASRWKLWIFTGTPLTLDNLVEFQYLKSSMAEWAIPCYACNKLNIAAIEYDLLKMIGPWHEDIGPHRSALICANSKCARPIDSQSGRWLHRKPERVMDFPGYHVPQPIMPMHCNDAVAWRELIAKQSGAGNYTQVRFYNEVLGESMDVGARLVTKTELEQAAILPWVNRAVEFGPVAQKLQLYPVRAMGVDWGGGGEDLQSFTTCAIAGLRGDGGIDVVYGRRLLTPNDHVLEAKDLLHAFNAFRCQFMAHDYNGAGSVRETVMVQSGLPLDRVIPITYNSMTTRDLMPFHAPSDAHGRGYYQLDKRRAILFVCEAIRLQLIKFFRYDFVDEDDRGLLHDFLSLIEQKTPTPRGSDSYLITKHPAFPDDFAHAVVYVCCAIWRSTNSWPNLPQIAALRASLQERKVHPNQTAPWFGRANS